MSGHVYVRKGDSWMAKDVTDEVAGRIIRELVEDDPPRLAGTLVLTQAADTDIEIVGLDEE
jgi:hypothetical protein